MPYYSRPAIVPAIQIPGSYEGHGSSPHPFPNVPSSQGMGPPSSKEISYPIPQSTRLEMRVV